MLCSSCMEPIQKHWKRCPVCLTKIQSKQCPTCNDILNANWKLCPKCDVADEEFEEIAGAVAAETFHEAPELGSDVLLPEKPLRRDRTIRHDGGVAIASREETFHDAPELGSDVLLPKQPLRRDRTIRHDGGVAIASREDAKSSKPKNKHGQEPLTKTIMQYLRGYRDGYKQHGLETVYLYAQVKKDVSQWKDVPLKILVTGESGVGKSSFINAMLGLNPKDENAAPVGITETTKEVKEYHHQDHSNFVLVDAPGVGTENFPKETYLQKVHLKDYDFVIIISANRFRANDAWLATESLKANKKFYFVRTKIDQDIESELENDGLDKSEVLKVVRNDCTQALTKLGFDEPNVFILSSSKKWREQFDLGRLIKDLLTDIPTLKKESMILSVSLKIQPVLEEKKEYLLKRIGRIALGSACKFRLNNGLKMLKDESLTYQMQFGVNEKSLEGFAGQLDIETVQLKEKIGLSSSTILNDDETFREFCLRIPESIEDIDIDDDRSTFERWLSKTYYNSFRCALYDLLMMCYEESQRILKLMSTFDD